MEDKGEWIPFNEKTEFEKYHMLVRRVGRKWRKPLFGNWDGKCYYTGEKLISLKQFKKNNKKVNGNKNKFNISIDHKISVSYGFKNNIDPKIIGNINNLCICRGSVNSGKGDKTEQEFLEYTKNKRG